MKLAEAQRVFDMAPEILESYITKGFIRKANTDEEEYLDADFERLGVIHTLMTSGCSNDEIRRYLSLDDTREHSTEQITLLKKWRKNLHGDIRQKQKILDQIDDLIWKMKKNV